LPEKYERVNTKKFTYTGNLDDNLTQAIFRDAAKKEQLGEVRFTYDTWKGDLELGGESFVGGGAILSGGFFFDSTKFTLAPGVQMTWRQIVKATVHGAEATKVWNAKDDTWIADTATRLSPSYPFEKLVVPDPKKPRELKQPSVAFTDDPARFPERGDQNWDA